MQQIEDRDLQQPKSSPPAMTRLLDSLMLPLCACLVEKSLVGASPAARVSANLLKDLANTVGFFLIPVGSITQSNIAFHSAVFGPSASGVTRNGLS